uniref:Uncharacterized protein n=1 Tax=Opuntia streptacantha TaxID=393608 RepID=A0A7C8YQM9_OPUST
MGYNFLKRTKAWTTEEVHSTYSPSINASSNISVGLNPSIQRNAWLGSHTEKPPFLLCRERRTFTASYRRSSSIFSPTSSGDIFDNSSEALRASAVQSETCKP